MWNKTEWWSSRLSIIRPANSMGQGVLRDIEDLLTKCENDDSVRVIIITGSGNKLFSAGADITEFASLQAGNIPKYNGNEIYFKIENYPKVVIAAMQGGAYGGGLELACCCHLRIMAEEATLGLPEVKLGLNPGWGGTQRLPRFIGKTKALGTYAYRRFYAGKRRFGAWSPQQGCAAG